MIKEVPHKLDAGLELNYAALESLTVEEARKKYPVLKIRDDVPPTAVFSANGKITWQEEVEVPDLEYVSFEIALDLLNLEKSPDRVQKLIEIGYLRENAEHQVELQSIAEALRDNLGDFYWCFCDCGKPIPKYHEGTCGSCRS